MVVSFYSLESFKAVDPHSKLTLWVTSGSPHQQTSNLRSRIRCSSYQEEVGYLPDPFELLGYSFYASVPGSSELHSFPPAYKCQLAAYVADT